ncbi:hypothetical protein K488DRAFT_79164 [Vararia minispora EC-137]|uniref:Uncharacterized protein n=1 Tax=Vararia minispora EC-137 TaxID=1314806 RepID=A0ACB8QHY1_9AGAM|nr:hypothetical protein K488DRAFT_79164 [Vararia minispora EC-137]
MLRRRASSSANNEPPSKRPKIMALSIEIDDDDDDAPSILTRTKEHEERGAGVHDPDVSSGLVRNTSSSKEVIVLDDEYEYDEEAALQWAMEESDQRSMQPRIYSGKSKQLDPSFTFYVPEDDIPPDERLLPHRDLFVRSSPCSKCGIVLPSPRGSVIFSANDPPPSLVMLLHLVCTRCKLVHCRGCLNPLSCTPTCKGPGSTRYKSCAAFTCCSEARAIALFEALCGFDRLYKNEQDDSKQRARQTTAKRPDTTAGSVGPGGTGYGTGTGGYSDGSKYSTDIRARAVSQMAEKHWDDIVVRALQTITNLLPAPYADEPATYDLLPHTSIGALLMLSQLPALLASLLRNDSVMDWSARGAVYEVMLALLRRLAECELTVVSLIQRPFERRTWAGIGPWMWNDEGKEKKAGSLQAEATPPRFERGTPLYAHFEKLTVQCKSFLRGAGDFIDGSGSAEEEMAMRAVSLCGDVIAARDDLKRAMTVLGAARTEQDENNDSSQNDGANPACHAKGKGRDLAVDMERQYAKVCEQLAFKHVSLSVDDSNGLSYPTFTFSSSVNSTSLATRNSKDRLHLIKELSTMATSLPPGIWVRVDEVRNDVIKILIAGPVGTPYEGGLFEFDCFMPLRYPHIPPQMHLRTTGGGTVRFNPNLYSNGKVCLSLLGTWSGRPEEMWSPGRSTLLQVVISIQSMILTEFPYFNEPGFGEADPNKAESLEYNKNIRRQTIKWAIIEWMKDEHRHGLWADVIMSHFSVRGASIRERWT